MNYLLVQTRSDYPQVFMTKADSYREIELISRKFNRLHEFYLHIFELAVNSQVNVPEAYNLSAVLLQKAGWVGPINEVDHYISLAGSGIERLPPRQAIESLTRGIDYLTKEVQRLEALHGETKQTA